MLLLCGRFYACPNFGLVEYFHVFEGSIALDKLGILPQSLADVHALKADVGLFSVIQGSQLCLNEVYLAYHNVREVNGEDNVSLGRFPYDSSSGDVLDISPPEITASKTTFSDFKEKKWVGIVYVLFKFAHQKVLAEAD